MVFFKIPFHSFEQDGISQKLNLTHDWSSLFRPAVSYGEESFITLAPGTSPQPRSRTRSSPPPSRHRF